MDQKRLVFPVLVMGVILVFPLLFMALGRDQSLFAYYGFALTKGIWPYTGYYEINAPGPILLNWLTFSVFGANSTAIRAVEFLGVIASALAIYFVWFKSFGNRNGLILAFVWLFQYLSLGYYHAGERDCWIAILQIFLLYLLVNINGIKLKAFGIGALVASIVLLRSTYLIFALSLFVVLAVFLRVQFNKKLVFITAVSALLVPTVVFSIQWAATGKLPISDLHFNLIRLTKTLYPAFGGNSFSVSNLYNHLLQVSSLIASICLMLLVLGKKSYSFKNDASKVVVFYSCSVVISYLIIAFIQGSLQRYHVLPLITFATFIFVYLLQAFERISFIPTTLSVVTALVFLPNFKADIKTILDNYKPVFGKISGNSVKDAHAPDYSPTVQKKLGQLLESNTRPDDKVALWALDPAPLFYAKRLSATRFPSPVILWLTKATMPDRFEPSVRGFLTDLEINRPKFFVIEEFDRKLGQNEDLIADNISEYPAIRDYVAKNYYCSDTLETYKICVRR